VRPRAPLSIQWIEGRPLRPSRDQNPAAFGFNQRQRLARRQADALEQCQARRPAPPAAQLLDQATPQSTAVPAPFLVSPSAPPAMLPTLLMPSYASRVMRTANRVSTTSNSLHATCTSPTPGEDPRRGSIGFRSPLREPGPAIGARGSCAPERSHPAPRTIGRSAPGKRSLPRSAAVAAPEPGPERPLGGALGRCCSRFWHARSCRRWLYCRHFGHSRSRRRSRGGWKGLEWLKNCAGTLSAFRRVLA